MPQSKTRYLCLLLLPALLPMEQLAQADTDSDGEEIELSTIQIQNQENHQSDTFTSLVPLEGKTAMSRFALPKSVEAVQTYNRQDIQNMRPRDVSDLIESSLGMSIGRQGARVHNFSYNRGDKVSIILDGVYLTQSEAQRILGDIPVEMIDSIQFLRDSSVITISPLMDFGSANSGSPNQGFIVINTRKSGPGKDGLEAKASYASFDTKKYSGWGGKTLLDGRLSFSGGYQRSESNGKPKWNMAYNADTWLASAGWKDEHLILTTSYYLNKASRNIQRAKGTYTGTTKYPVSGPTPAGVLDKNIWKYPSINNQVISVNLARPWNDIHTTTLTYGRSNDWGTGYYYTTTTSKADTPARNFRDRAEEWNLSHTIATTRTTTKLGVQTVDWYQLTEGKTTPRKEKVYGYYGTFEYRFTPAFSMDAAARLDRKYIKKGGDAYLSNGNVTQLSSHRWMDDAKMFSVGAAWQINPVWRLSSRFSYNRTPTPDSITTEDDKKLPAEKRYRYEFGINARFSPALNATLTPFYYVIKNAKVSNGSITTDAAGNTILDAYGNETSVTIYRAQDQVIRKGLEIMVNGHLLDDRLSYELGWTYYDDSEENGQTGSETPDNKYNARLGWRQGAWNANLSMTHVDSYLSYDYKVGNFTTLNANLGYDLPYGLNLSVYGQNLLNQHYATNNKGYPATANWGRLQDVGATYGVEMGLKF